MNERFRDGDTVEVRVPGRDWRRGLVTLASTNGKSVAVDLEDGSLGVGGMLINPMHQCVTLLLELTKNGWFDVASGALIEMRGTVNASTYHG